jgi:chromosome partitioning protein
VAKGKSAKIITFGIQKGGAAKTTTTGITAYLLSQQGYRVLCVDLDSQGNLTELLTLTDVQEFRGRTSLEALQELDPRPYIIAVSDHIHLLPAEDLLATFSRWLYVDYRGKTPRASMVKTMLDHVKESYDYILLDTPPALGDITMNALVASDLVVPLFESSRFCYSAIKRFLESVTSVQELANPKLQVAGILRAMIDNRRSDNKQLIELMAKEYPDITFNTVINRKAATGRLAVEGFFQNKEINDAVEQYRPFIEELKNSAKRLDG